MSKDPAFLFYPNDYLGGTLGMSFELKGAYIDLFILQFNKGEFLEEQAVNMVGEVRWNQLKHKFETNGKLFWNVRLKVEIDKRKSYGQSRRDNISNRYKKSTHEPTYVTSHVTTTELHMGNENKDENEKLFKGLTLPFTSPGFLASLQELLALKKWKSKPISAIQKSLDKVKHYDEEFVITELIDSTIAGNYMGLVFPDTRERYNKWYAAKNISVKPGNKKFPNSFSKAFLQSLTDGKDISSYYQHLNELGLKPKKDRFGDVVDFI